MTKALQTHLSPVSKKSFEVYSVLLGVCIALFAITIINRSWLSDDAFITFRTIDNFWNGYGLVWNVNERVQTYTHPLWMLLLSAVGWFTHELVFTSQILSIVISLIAILILVKVLAVSRQTAFFCTLALLLSNSYVDYSTSGLENPLSHLILIIFFAIYFIHPPSVPKVFVLSLLASLLALNRYDLILIVLPALLFEVYRALSLKTVAALLAGQFLLIAWLAFSIVYYGFPFPNTAYAKLNTGILAWDLILQGFQYFRYSANFDPLALAIIGSGLLLSVLDKGKQQIWVGLGIILYLLYILKIGGDFMSGRFLSAPFLCAIIIISQFDLSRLSNVKNIMLLSVVTILGLLSPWPTLNFSEELLSPKERSAMVNDALISNERKYYDWSNSLFRINPVTRIPEHPYALDGIAAQSQGQDLARRITVGMFGYYAGPGVYVLDELALGDALLARLPARRLDRWRIGHFQRTLPDGYLETLKTGENRLADHNLARFYDQLTQITRGNLFDRERWRAIWLINTSQLNFLIDQDTYRLPKLVQVQVELLNNARLDDNSGISSSAIAFQESGIEIIFGKTIKPSNIEISLDGNNSYQLIYLQNGDEVGKQKLEMKGNKPGLQSTCLEVLPKARKTGFDALRIFSIAGDSQYSLGNIQIDQCSDETNRKN